MAEVGSTVLGLNKSSLLTVAGLAGAAFVGYAIYCDHKRRSDPDYKQKIRDKRRAKMGRRGVATGAATDLDGASLPDPRNPTQMQAFFLQEVQIGEELMASGNIEEGAVHIANAIILCGQSQQLLSIFQQTLPPEQFAAVLQALPTARERLSDVFGAAADAAEEASAGDGPAIQYVGAPDGEDSHPQIQELIDDELE